MNDLRDQTSLLSSTDQIRRQPAYRAVLAQGKFAVPMLLKAIHKPRQATVAIVLLLEQITGKRPDVEPSNMDARVAYWRRQ